jgi:hypothetical protein
MAINLNFKYGPKLLQENVEVRVFNHVVQAYSVNKSKWVDLDQSDWFIEAPREPEVFYVYKDNKIRKSDFLRVTEQAAEMRGMAPEDLRAKFKVVIEFPKYTLSHARSQNGRVFRNFRYVSGKLFADVYAW